MRWEVGITTAERPGEPKLKETIFSLTEAGFYNLTAYADIGFCPDVSDTPASRCTRTSEKKTKLGAYGNLISTLQAMLQRNEFAQLYAVFQDDVQAAVGLRDWLDQLYRKDLRSDESAGFANSIVSVYTAKSHAWETTGWKMILDGFNYREGPVPYSGGLGMIFPKELAKRFVEEAPNRESLHRSDFFVAKWCAMNDIPLWLHSPSLLQHTGDLSAIRNQEENDHGLTKYRQAGVFCNDVEKLKGATFASDCGSPELEKTSQPSADN